MRYLSKQLGGSIKSKKVPLTVRLILVTVLCGFIIAISVLAGISALNDKRVTGAVIAFIISLGLTTLWLFWCVKIIQSRNKK